jgi:hypothetical protein
VEKPEVNSVPPLTPQAKAKLLALYDQLVADGHIVQQLPATECDKIALVITALQKVFSEHCPIAES